MSLDKKKIFISNQNGNKLKERYARVLKASYKKSMFNKSHV